MPELRIEELRNGRPESSHRVSAAVVGPDGTLVASWGDPHLVTFMRSAAKPFQALPLLLDGAAARYNLSARELALACASHNSEREQVDLVRGLLGRIGCTDSDLACGPHRSLGLSFSVPPVEPDLLCEPSPAASNCSGKHAGMLTLAQHHGWAKDGYQRTGHPVQLRLKREVARWVKMDTTEIGEGVDGCTVVTFALPLSRMAQAMARLIVSRGDEERAIVSSMMEHPELVAGRGRLCTALMRAYAGNVLAKVGAAGVYVAAIRERGIGVCLKVEDGHSSAAMMALLAILDSLSLSPTPSERLPQFADMPVYNTRCETVGAIRVARDTSI